MSPNTSPVIAAAGHSPTEPRRAVKKNPRKKNSSQIGATRQTSTAVATSAAVDLSAPSCWGRSSSSLTPSAFISTDQNAEKTKKPSQATSSQPTAGQTRGRRSPNCAAVGFAVKNEKTTAQTISPASCTNVAAMLTAGVGLLEPLTASPTISAKVAIANVPSSASGGSHQGQRGSRAAGGTMPSGSSGCSVREAISSAPSR